MNLTLLSVTLLVSGVAPPATLDVPGTYATIQAAIDVAVAGDEVVIAPGTYSEVFDLKGKAITVRSSAGPDVTIVDGAGLAESIVLADSGETVATLVQGLTFLNGEGGLHANCVAPKPVGGATYVGDGSALTVVDCVYRDNGLSGEVVEGAAVYVYRGSLRVEGCLFENNGVLGEGFGGGIGSCVSKPNQFVEILGCAFVDNASAFGAGAKLSGFADAKVIDTTFTGNEASHGAGLFAHGHWQYAWELLVDACTFKDNEASFGAGADIIGDRNVAATQTTLTVSDCEFVDNHAGFGGGLVLNLSMDTGFPGPDARAYVTDCEFMGNVVDACCNTGIYHTPCFVDGVNNGRYWGGAADMRTQYGGLIEITNCLVHDNDAVRAGGFHLATCGGGEIRLINSTIADNLTSGVHVRQGVEALQLPANVSIANTVLTDNGTQDDDQLIDKSASDPLIAFEARYNLVQGGFAGPGNVDGDPAFLAPEVGAYCLESGSDAIDAGDNGVLPAYLVEDIEGLPRRVDDPNTADTGNGSAPIVDMGAHEAQDGGCLLGSSYCGPAIPNSIGLSGKLRAAGSDVAGEDLVLLASDLPPNQFGYFLLSQTQGATIPPGSSGRLCLAGTIGRFNRSGEVGSSGAAGELSLLVDTSDIPLLVGSIQSGETWSFQAWHRDVGGTSNFTDGVEIVFE